MDSGRVLTEDEQIEIAEWRKGFELRTVVQSDAWEILKDTLKDYVDKADFALRQLAPGDPAVPTAHAALSALDQMYRYFIYDIEAAVEKSHNNIPLSLHRIYKEGIYDNPEEPLNQ
jgi:hypothetical protein